MKIGIMTINSAHNYGCVMQAWSLRYFLTKEGHDASVINYRLPEIDDVYKLFHEEERFSNKALNACYNEFRRLRFRLTEGKRIKKAERFEYFVNNVMGTTKPYYSYEELCEQKAAEPYDVLVTGSDQVWNSIITKGVKPAYFLQFDNGEKRKISYAASIGKQVLDDEDKRLFTKYLATYSRIAVRENMGKDLITPLTDKPVEVVLDPTLLLEREDFDTLKKPSKYKKPYIFVHVIGKDERLEKIVEHVSKVTGLPVVQNRPTQQFTNELGTFADGGPMEFLGLIDDAALVITNSFHATVFSIVYEKTFVTIPHVLYPERMQNLLGKIGLYDRLIETVDALPEDIFAFHPDYVEVKKLLHEEQEKSRAYLRSALTEDV